MAKLVASSNAMPDTPSKAAMMREMGAANAAMAKGDMRGACKSYNARPANERSERLDIIPEGQPAWLVLRIERIR
jgi:hypothetical protein